MAELVHKPWVAECVWDSAVCLSLLSSTSGDSNSRGLRWGLGVCILLHLWWFLSAVDVGPILEHLDSQALAISRSGKITFHPEGSTVSVWNFLRQVWEIFHVDIIHRIALTEFLKNILIMIIVTAAFRALLSAITLWVFPIYHILKQPLRNSQPSVFADVAPADTKYWLWDWIICRFWYPWWVLEPIPHEYLGMTVLFFIYISQLGNQGRTSIWRIVWFQRLGLYICTWYCFWESFGWKKQVDG